MEERKLGPWHPNTKEQKPVHLGLYHCRYPDGSGAFMSYWDGKFWRYTSGINSKKRIWQNLQWRGLSEKPE